MKKKKNRYTDPYEDVPVVDYEPPETTDALSTPAAEPEPMIPDTTLFFDDGEEDTAEPTALPTDAPATPQEAPAPQRVSLRFRVKTVYRSGKAMPEGTRLFGVSQSIRALSEENEKTKKKKQKKEKKEQKLPEKQEKKTKKQKTTLPAAEPPKENPLQEVFSAPPAKEEKAPKKPKAKTGTMDYVRYAMLFLCFTVFLYSSYTLIDSLVSRAQSRSEYDQLSDSFHAASPFIKDRLPAELPNAASVDLLSAYVGVQPEEYTPSLRDENAQTKIDKVTFLKNNKNKDTVGWIIIPGTNIDYPVVNTKDNDFYLRRSYYGKTNLSGTLFTDSRNSKKLMENRNTVIYGHNMNDGSMFNNLHDLKNEALFRDCKIEIATPNGIFIYEVFSIHEALETSEYFQCTFRDDEHFGSWLEEMKGESLYKKEGMELSPGDKVLTLSTCMDPIIQSEYRWAVHAKLVEVINYTP